MNPDATVFVVDADQTLRESLRRLMESVGLQAETCSNARAFLRRYDPARPSCLLLDINMNGMNGLELQEKLAREGLRIPVIFISAHADVEAVVRAIKTGAVDFIQKPFRGNVLLDRVRQALELDTQIRREEVERADVAACLALLTRREREVMDLLVTGKSSKQIAFELGISRKTVDIHRNHLMSKLEVDSVVDLVRLAQIHGTGTAMFPLRQTLPSVDVSTSGVGTEPGNGAPTRSGLFATSQD